MTVQATETEKSAATKVEELLKKRAKLEAKHAKIMEEIDPQITKISTGIKDIDLDLLELAEANKGKWWPDDSKTKDFENGKLFWRATSSLITADGEPVDEENTDLLGLAKRKGLRHLVKITAQFSKIKGLIEAGKMPKGFEGIKIKIIDKFNVSTK